MKKILCAAVAVMMSLVFLSGCGVKYHAKIYSHVEIWLQDKFLIENMTYGAYYLNPDYQEEESDSNDQYLYDTNSPRTRTFLIKDQAKFDEIFKEFPPEIDFDKEMIVLHLLTVMNSRPFILKQVKWKEDILKITYKVKPAKLGVKDTTTPKQTCLIVKLDKLDITTAEFIEK